MLLSKYAILSTNNRNYKKFLNLGYDFKIGDKISVSVDHLNPGTKSMVEAKCDICGEIKNVRYSSYIKNISKYDIYTCNGKCSNVKFKKTCLEKFGCEYPLQNERIKSDLKEYFIAEYGVKHPSMLEKFTIKAKNTKLEIYGDKTYSNPNKGKSTKLDRYGSENYNNEIKHKETCLKLYGNENYNNMEKMKSSKLEIYGDENFNNREKYAETNLEKYGVGNTFQNEEIKNKIKSDNLEKYGFEFYQSTYEYKEKYKKTSLVRYGVEHPMQNFEIHKRQEKSAYKLSKYKGLSYRGTYELDFLKYCEKNNIEISVSDKLLYEYNGMPHYYFPDFFIKSHNLICEVKSGYYYKLNEDKNLCKKEFSIKNGYNFLFIIDKDYNELEKIITHVGHTTI